MLPLKQFCVLAIISLQLNSSGGQQYENNIIIDTETELNLYHGSTTCDYRWSNSVCNFPNDNGVRQGFWSTCVTGKLTTCSITISILEIVNVTGRLPINLRVVAGVGLNSYINVRHQYPSQMLEPAINPSDVWNTVDIDLTQVKGLTNQSEFIITGYLGLQTPGNIVVDSLNFTFPKKQTTTTTTVRVTKNTETSIGNTEESTFESTVSTPEYVESSTTSGTGSSLLTTDSTPNTYSTTQIVNSTFSTLDTESTAVPTTQSDSGTSHSTESHKTTSNSVSPERTSSTPKYCERDVFCAKTDRFGESWKGCPGELVFQHCPKNVTGRASWFCEENGRFRGHSPNYSNCSSQWLIKIEDEVAAEYEDLPIPETRAKELIRSITQRTESSTYFGHEIGRIVGVSTEIFTKVSEIGHPQFEVLADRTWRVFGAVMAAKEPWEELTIEAHPKTGTDFVNELENMSLELAHRTKGRKYRRNFNEFEQFRVMAGVEPKEKSQLKFPEDSTPEDSQLILPADWANYLEEEKVQFVGLEIRAEESNYLFPTHINQLTSARNNHESETGKILNANILGFSFGSIVPNTRKDLGINFQNGIYQRGVNFTGEGVQVMFRHAIETSTSQSKDLRRRQHSGEIQKPVLGSGICAYWDTVKLEWSTSGCVLLKSDQGVTLCECSHLTSFALLMDVHNFVGKDAGLEILTLILAPLSIISMVASIGAFTMINSKLGARAKITKYLCISLLVAHTLFLLLVDRNYMNLSEGVCAASAMVVHYAFLTVFGWTAIQGYHLYRQMTHVFQSGTFHMGFYSGIALGIPIPIVGTTALVAFINDEKGYGGEMFCWLNGNYILWAFMIPVALVCLGNIVVLSVTLKAAQQVQSSSLHKIQRRVRSYKTLSVGVLSITVLLGLTWLTGFFILVDSSNSIFFGYVFTLLNASQGIFIFVFHCLLNIEVRTAITKKLRLKAPLWFSSSSTNETSSGTSKFRSNGG